MLKTWKKCSVYVAAAGIAASLALRFLLHTGGWGAVIPLWCVVGFGGTPLIVDLLRQLWRREFGADFLAALSIVTAAAMGQWLVAAIIVLMLAGGQALEEYATARASSVLSALARRTPSIAHRWSAGKMQEIGVAEIAIGDRLTVLPHEICPVDGSVLEGTGSMDESFLTGEPFRIRKTVGSQVISGALNEDAALTIVAEKLPQDSRYARIMQVMVQAEKSPPHLRRLGDTLGAIYTPVAVAIALAGWGFSGDATRFLAVLVIATPCPLLLAIPTAVIGAVSLAARRSIVIRKPVVLEQVGSIRTMLFDKTGTLTHGEPVLSDIVSLLPGLAEHQLLQLAASLEQFSKHPLSLAILEAAKEQRVEALPVENISERPGAGMTGVVEGRQVKITGRRKLPSAMVAQLPQEAPGMECVLLVDDVLAGLMRFEDKPRKEGRAFMDHLRPRHQVSRLMILSGDRDAEVQHLASIMGIHEVHAGLLPEEKLQIVREETAKAPTLFLGDGVNDAPAMMAATVGIAFGQSNDITAEAAGAVILDTTLERVDELLHIGRRMRRIALQSAVGGMALSTCGMIAAAMGYLPPLAGALGQEGIDLLAVLNALRASLPGRELQDFEEFD
ncbi:heavy metal translocating P-type ATPase [Terriglobus tenax]|uniref:heavy metal translocating P-type ATPase n=1 Tax=Terriglobus tenax TaxID=1111115 RepID=UPI0021E00797|nr:heavy metal translocating P-type ATPase [Terriglobus tenax]